MVIHRPGVALEAFGVRHGVDFALDRQVLDLAVSLAQPVAIRVDALLHGVTVLPHLVTLGYRAKVWASKSTIVTIRPDRRYIIVASHGGALRKSSLDTAWQRFITSAIEDGTIMAEQRFGLHDLKRRGITDTAANRADKQEASGHRDGAMMDVYDLSVPLVNTSQT